MDPAGNLLPLLSGVPVILGGSPRSGALPQQGAPGKHCNCKNSRCLKLYCECFASGRYCENCSCKDCLNNQENESKRQPAVDSILERNPHAFRPKIQAQAEVIIPSHTSPPVIDAVGKHSKGCNCKKSACLKKYCECFQAGVFCSSSCRCMECKNYEGSDQRAQVIACLSMPHPSSSDHGAGSGKGLFAASASGGAASTSTSRPHLANSPPHKRARTAAVAAPHQTFNPSSLFGSALAGGALPPGLPFCLPPVAPIPASSPPAVRPIPALSVPFPIKAPPPNSRPLPPPAAPAATASAAPTSIAPPPSSATDASRPAAAQPQKWPLFHQVIHRMLQPSFVEHVCSLLMVVAGDEDQRQQEQQQGQQQQEGNGSLDCRCAAQPLNQQARFEAQEQVVLEEFLSTLQKILAAADQQVAELQAASKQQRPSHPKQPPHAIPAPPPAALPVTQLCPADDSSIQRQAQQGPPGRPSKLTAPPPALPLELPPPRGPLSCAPVAGQPPPPVAAPGLHFTQPPLMLGTNQGHGEGQVQGDGQEQQPHHQQALGGSAQPPAGTYPGAAAVEQREQRQQHHQGNTSNEQPGG